jgi:hypothetical protein
MNTLVFAVLCMFVGAVLGQLIRKYYNSIKLREQAAKDAVDHAFGYVHQRIDAIYGDISGRINETHEHFHNRVKSTEQSISSLAHVVESHAKQLAGDVKSDVKAAGKKI